MPETFHPYHDAPLPAPECRTCGGIGTHFGNCPAAPANWHPYAIWHGDQFDYSPR